MKAVCLIAIQLLALISAQAQRVQSLEARINAIVNRPEFQRALFGIEVYSLTDNKILYALNSDKLFVPGSVTKLITEGAAAYDSP